MLEVYIWHTECAGIDEVPFPPCPSGRSLPDSRVAVKLNI